MAYIEVVSDGRGHWEVVCFICEATYDAAGSADALRIRDEHVGRHGAEAVQAAWVDLFAVLDEGPAYRIEAAQRAVEEAVARAVIELLAEVEVRDAE